MHEKANSKHQTIHEKEISGEDDNLVGEFQQDDKDDKDNSIPLGDNDTYQDSVTQECDLLGILKDLNFRVEQGDHNLQKGLQKFITTYQKLLLGPAPTASLASAFHHFGEKIMVRCMKNAIT